MLNRCRSYLCFIIKWMQQEQSGKYLSYFIVFCRIGQLFFCRRTVFSYLVSELILMHISPLLNTFKYLPLRCHSTFGCSILNTFTRKRLVKPLFKKNGIIRCGSNSRDLSPADTWGTSIGSVCQVKSHRIYQEKTHCGIKMMKEKSATGLP